MGILRKDRPPPDEYPCSGCLEIERQIGVSFFLCPNDPSGPFPVTVGILRRPRQDAVLENRGYLGVPENLRKLIHLCDLAIGQIPVGEPEASPESSEWLQGVNIESATGHQETGLM